MPKYGIPARWGICFAGNESGYCEALDAALDACHSNPFVYVEIGIGHGETLNAAAEYLEQSGRDYRLNGVDLPSLTGPAANKDLYRYPDKLDLHLVGAADFFEDWQDIGQKADFIFIDGCHGAPCVTADFLAAEKIINPGGVVAFHDTDVGCQDIHWQPHCQSGIKARLAVASLGLLTDSRPGWRKIGETTGDKARGGHGCLFVQRC